MGNKKAQSEPSVAFLATLVGISKVPEPPSRRAQAAVEFLITNGWAILTVIILLAALFYIGVLSPQQKQPNTCAFSPGLTCYSFKVGSENGSLELDFGQALGKSIQVTGISCSPNESASFTAITPVHIPSGEHRWIAGQDSGNTNITCEGATGGLGARYSGRVCVSYEELATRTTRIACCDMRAQLEPASTSPSTPTPTPIPTPTPTPAPCDPKTTWSEGGTLIDTPGNYTLESPLTATKDCIYIYSNDVTLDCRGYGIAGSGGGYGIFIFHASGVTVENCNVSSFDNCIFLDASNNILTGNTALNCQVGIFLGKSSSNNNLTGNTACWNVKDNIYCDSGQNDLGGNICTPYGETVCTGSITCNPTCPPQPPRTITNCGTAISSQGTYLIPEAGLTSGGGVNCITFYPGSEGSTLDCQGHSITGTSQSGNGITLNTGNITIENCVVSNFSFGINSYGSSNIFRNNTANSNWGGISVVDCINCLLTGNTANWNSNGILLYSSNSNNLTDNTANWNAQGIELAYSSNNVLVGNNADSNIWYGILFDFSSNNNNLTGNSANANDNYGIYMISSSTSNNFINNTVCWNQVYCDSGQNDLGSNICQPYGGTVCYDGITCNPTCPPPPPPACAPNWVVGACGCALNVPGNYTINASGLVSTGGTCITIISDAGGSTLDCQGDLINGSVGGTGIYLTSGTNGVTVENCDVRNFAQGISLYSADGNTLMNNTATSNVFGIHLVDSSNNNLTDNIANANDNEGIYMVGSSTSNNFTGNTICWNQGNIYCSSGQNEGGGNICTPYGGTVCSDSITCHATCPPPPPPACAPNWVVGTCGCSLTVPGNYTINASGLVSTGGGSCITMYDGASGSTLDCQGNSIDGQGLGGDGIYLSDTNGVTVKNCNLNNFGGSGVDLWDSHSNSFTSNNASANAKGIYLVSSSNNVLTNNNLSSNSDTGIYLTASSTNNNLTGNTANSNYYGIVILSSSNNNLTGNNATSNSGYGIYVVDSINCLLTGNTACWNQNENIYCDSGQGDLGSNICTPYGGTVCFSSITCNTGCPPPPPPACAPDWVVGACGCTLNVPGNYTINASGLSSTGSDCITITSGGSGSILDCQGNSIDGQGSYYPGIFLFGASGVTVKNCNLNNFRMSGIYLLDSSNNLLTSNNASANARGIYLSSSSSNILANNNLSSNSETGIELVSSSTNNLTGNTANSNYFGIIIISSSNNNLTGNNVSSNSGYGIYVVDTINCLLTGNTACNPLAYYDIYCDPAPPGDGGNTCDSGKLSCGPSVTCDYGCPPSP